MQSLSMCWAKKAMSSARSLEDGGEQEYLRKSFGEVGRRRRGRRRRSRARSSRIRRGACVVFEFSARKVGTEGVDAAEGQAIRLDVELAGDRQARRLAEEVEPSNRRWPRSSRGGFARSSAETRNIAPAPFGVAGRDDRRMHPDESALVEVAMDGHREAVAHPRHRAEGVGPRPEMGDRTQVLERVPLGRDRITGPGPRHMPTTSTLIGLDLEPLPLALRLHERPHGTRTAQWVVR